MDARHERALDQVLELTLLLTDDMNRSFERDGLTPARAHLLWVLRGGPSTQRALADALRVSPRNITGLVDGLEASGLVVRRPHPTDRRSLLVGCTDAGARLVAEMARGQVQLATGLFGALTETEVVQLSTLLGGVIDRLKGMIAEADATGVLGRGGRGARMIGVLRKVPRLLWHAVVFELAMYRNLLRWVARRPSVGPGDEPVGYARLVTPVMCLWIFASAAEVPLLHVLLPWRSAQVVSVVLGVWTLVWMLGLLAGLRTRPHLMSEEALRVRNGAFVDIRVPWDAIASVTTKEIDLPSSMRSLQPTETESGTDLRVGVSGQVNVQVQLRAPLSVPTRGGELSVSRVSFWVDEPRQVAAWIRERMVSRGAAR